MRVGLMVGRALRCRPPVLAVAALLQLALQGGAGGQTLDQALSQLRSGEYDAAIPALRELAAPRGQPQWSEWRWLQST